MKKLKLKDHVAELASEATQVIHGMIEQAAEKATQQPDAFMPHTGSTELATQHLRSFVERVERLKEEQDALAADMTELMAEIKGNGFDAATVRDIVKLRAMDDGETKLAMLKHYHDALGMTVWPS